MKIYAVTDLHSNMKLVNKAVQSANKYKADLLIVTGDLTFFSNGLETVLKKLKDNIPLMVLPGNHEDINEMRRLCKKLGIIFLHKATFEVDNYLFVGYGNDGFALKDEGLENFVKKIRPGKKTIITLTHGPPYGTKLDYLSYIGHVGCKSINIMINKLKPKIHLCGHIHETFGVKDKIDNTILINPGPSGLLINL